MTRRILFATLAMLAVLTWMGAAGAAAGDFTSADCAECHTGSGGDPPEVTIANIEASVHAGLDCVDCHAGITDLPHDTLPPVDCGICHEDESDTYKVHGRGVVGESTYIPKCKDCHGTHDILPSSDRHARTNPLNLPTTCGRCHEDSTLVADLNIKFVHPIRVYRESVHGKATAGGIHQAATCNDCHSTGGTAHRILPPNDPRSTITTSTSRKPAASATARSSRTTGRVSTASSPRRARWTRPSAPPATASTASCRRTTRAPRSARTAMAEATCTPCHESAELNEKYDLPTGRLQSYVDSYHGLKSRAGDKTVANCASCHGAHLILPSSDPRSSVYPGNLQKTCGHCHTGITADVARQPDPQDGDADRKTGGSPT